MINIDKLIDSVKKKKREPPGRKSFHFFKKIKVFKTRTTNKKKLNLKKKEAVS